MLDAELPSVDVGEFVLDALEFPQLHADILGGDQPQRDRPVEYRDLDTVHGRIPPAVQYVGDLEDERTPPYSGGLVPVEIQEILR